MEAIDTELHSWDGCEDQMCRCTYRPSPRGQLSTNASASISFNVQCPSIFLQCSQSRSELLCTLYRQGHWGSERLMQYNDSLGLKHSQTLSLSSHPIPLSWHCSLKKKMCSAINRVSSSLAYSTTANATKNFTASNKYFISKIW